MVKAMAATIDSPPFYGKRWAPSKVKRQRIGDRDGWICWLCLLPVDPGLPIDHPERASLDHVRRRRDGGSHRERNLRLAHFICNQLRG